MNAILDPTDRTQLRGLGSAIDNAINGEGEGDRAFGFVLIVVATDQITGPGDIEIRFISNGTEQSAATLIAATLKKMTQGSA